MDPSTSFEPVIHPTALIDSTARIGRGSSIGAYTVVEAGATIGEANSIGASCHIHSGVVIGRGNRLMRGVCVGSEAQSKDASRNGAPPRVGDDNWLGEYVTIHRATSVEDPTTVGDGTYLMAHCHVGHDASIGNEVTMANGVNIGGHVMIGAGVTVGGGAAIHQFVRTGPIAMIGGLARVTQDVLPFTQLVGDNRLAGLNTVGLSRSADHRKLNRALLKEAYREFCRRRVGHAQFLEWLVARSSDPLLKTWLTFMKPGSKRGYARARPRSALRVRS